MFRFFFGIMGGLGLINTIKIKWRHISVDVTTKHDAFIPLLQAAAAMAANICMSFPALQQKPPFH